MLHPHLPIPPPLLLPPPRLQFHRSSNFPILQLRPLQKRRRKSPFDFRNRVFRKTLNFKDLRPVEFFLNCIAVDFDRLWWMGWRGGGG